MSGVILTGEVSQTGYEPPAAPSPAPVSYNPIYWPPVAGSNVAPPATAYNGPDLNSAPAWEQNGLAPGGFDFGSVFKPQTYAPPSPGESVTPPASNGTTHEPPPASASTPQGVQELNAPPPGALNSNDWLMLALLALGVGTALYLMGKPSKHKAPKHHKHPHHTPAAPEGAGNHPAPSPTKHKLPGKVKVTPKHKAGE